ncbi:MAG: YraN family protein [Xanthomonadales bacterium]
MPSTRSRGSEWERVAESFLHGKGLKTLSRNYRGRGGEIDLVMLDGETLVFTEVRFRARRTFGGGAASVTPAKQERICRAARQFLQRERKHARRPCRFDVVAIGDSDGRAQLHWIRSAFEAG